MHQSIDPKQYWCLLRANLASFITIVIAAPGPYLDEAKSGIAMFTLYSVRGG